MILRRLRFYPKLVCFIVIIVVIFVAVNIFLFLEKNLKPTIIAVAEARAKIIAFDSINEAITEKVAQNIRYQDLVEIEKDNSGRIVMAQVNSMEVNRIQAETVRRVQNTLKTIEGEVVKIPAGQALGSEILANYGPRIPVNLVPIGTVHVDVSHSFDEAGINQTRHKIYIQVYADVQIIVPFVSASREVMTEVPIADTVYMGDVPDTVINLPLPMKDGNQSISQSTEDGGQTIQGTGEDLNFNDMPFFNP